MHYVNTDRGAEDEPPLSGWRVLCSRGPLPGPLSLARARCTGKRGAKTRCAHVYVRARARRLLGQNGVDPPPMIVRG